MGTVRSVVRVVSVLAAALLLAGALAEPEVVRATVGGVVVDTVRAGDVVEEGAPLVWVRTATKPREVAARSPRNGTVVEVLVQVGARVRVGDPVVRLGP
jgi:biotin carboxyl carrier protein